MGDQKNDDPEIGSKFTSRELVMGGMIAFTAIIYLYFFLKLTFVE